MTWFFPWSTGRCHNCFGKKKSQQAILSSQVRTYTDIKKSVSIQTAACAQVKEGSTGHCQPTDSMGTDFCWTYVNLLA